MVKRTLLVALAAGLVLLLGQGIAAGSPGDVQCTGAFSGSARDLIVPANGFCLVNGATISQDLIVEPNAQLAVENTTIGHDLRARKAAQIETGCCAALTGGPVQIGHDLRIEGSAAPNGIGYDICHTTINHDLQIINTNVQDEIDVGDVGPQGDEFCSYSDSPPDHVGHDLIVSGNTTGAGIDIGNNTVGHDLIADHNTAGTYIDVSDNTVGHDARCTGDNPPPSKDGSEDGPNQAQNSNTCG